MVYSGESDEKLLAIANDTMFGLGNSVWTSDENRALFFAKNLESGTVSINQTTNLMLDFLLVALKILATEQNFRCMHFTNLFQRKQLLGIYKN
jgi:hypothetical protein